MISAPWIRISRGNKENFQPLGSGKNLGRSRQRRVSSTNSGSARAQGSSVLNHAARRLGSPEVFAAAQRLKILLIPAAEMRIQGADIILLI